VFLIGGEKHSHREGLYQCKPCRRSFSVTVDTPMERLRVPLSAWVSAAREFSYQAPKPLRDSKPTLLDLQSEIAVSYRTVLRMRDIIKRAAGKYRGHKYVFGAWPLHDAPTGKARGDHSAHWGASGSTASARLHTGRVEPH
jgi:transposase-like protein